MNMAPTVLIIEDDELLREVYAAKFAMEGFIVDTAQDGREGLQKATASRPDLILLDMAMPLMNGLEFLETYRPATRQPQVATVIISNKSTASEINRAKALGVRDYLIKAQHTPDQLVAKIRRYL
jgi:CheY-like chemotaxis protein